MRDFRAELELGGCKNGHGCNAASVCLCGMIEDAADEVTQLRDALQEILAAPTIQNLVGWYPEMEKARKLLNQQSGKNNA